MKRILFSLAVFLIGLTTLKAQFAAGVKLGMSSTDIEASDLNIFDQNGIQELSMSIENANYGFLIGGFMRIPIKKFFIQPEVLFNSNSVDYRVTDFRQQGFVDTILREKYQYLDIPLMLGFKFGPLRLNGGPVSHIFLGSNTQLNSIQDYGQMFKNAEYGWQAGLGLDIWKIAVDLRYEGNFNKFGDHITIGGEQFSFDDSPARFVATIGYTF
ncbi:MAG TPA: PorT family protein [Phaeodactylibacter sp.]|nr:PorT family protein [Phaeodactylibacter sp.]